MCTLISNLVALLLLANVGFAEEPSFCFPTEEKKWDVFADVLVWNLQETCSQWAFVIIPKFVTQPAAPFTGKFNADLDMVTFEWKPGVRTGLSYTFDHDCWNTRFYYTWYQTHGSRHIIPPPGNVIQSQFIATDFLLTLPSLSLSFNEAKIRWNVFFNMFNWDLGRIFTLGDSLSLRPYLGLQGGWIHQKVRASWLNSNTTFPYSAFETLKHRFWGVGPEVGIDSRWNVWSGECDELSIYGDFGQAYLWGHWSFNEVAHTTENITTINTQPDRNMGSLTFLGSSGFIWDARLNNDLLLFTVKVGYEFQIWTQHLQFFQHFSGILNNALILQGVTCRFLFEF